FVAVGLFFFSSRRRHTRFSRDWRSDVCSSDLGVQVGSAMVATRFVVDQTGPTSLALLRYAIGFCCLLPVLCLSAGPVRFARRDRSEERRVGKEWRCRVAADGLTGKGDRRTVST